jgi:hypothetical protein
MSNWKNFLGYEVTLTDLFGYKNVRSAWQAYLPLTKNCVSTINRSFNDKLVIPPCPWVSKNRRYGYLGEVYDHAVGLLFAGRSHLLPIRKHVYSLSLSAQLQSLFDPLEDLLRRETSAFCAGKKGERQLDLVRALVLLIDLRAKASGFDPAVPLPKVRVQPADDLRLMLRKRYPDEFISELQTLVEATKEDLPQRKPLCYKPSFGGAWGKIEVAATGDLLIRNLLLDLKVSVRLFKGEDLWQLLGYTAIDADNRGNSTIQMVGGYNPRYRALWTKSIDDLTRQMGADSFKSFCRWLRSTLPKLMNETGAGFPKVKSEFRSSDVMKR